MVELILAESAAILRAERGVLITETRHGFVCANAGIDGSNLPERGHGRLLPEDPTHRRAGSAPRSASGPAARSGWSSPTASAAPGGSASAEVAIGCAGLAPLDDWRGRTDAAGRALEATLIAIADQAAAAAGPGPRQDERNAGQHRPRPQPLRHR